MRILITRHYKVFFEKIYLVNIQHDVTTAKIPFLSLLPRKCMSRYFSKNFFPLMHGHYQYRQKSILKNLLSLMIWDFYVVLSILSK